MLNWRTDRPIDNGYFIGPSVAKGTNVKITLSFPEFISRHQKSVHSINFFVRYSHSFWVLRPEWAQPFMTTPTPILFIQLLISINCINMQKSRLFLSCSTDLVDLKILRSDWSRAFWPISEEPEFYQIWDLSKHTAINISFDYIHSKNARFDLFSPFWWQKYYFQKVQLSCITPYVSFTPCWIPEKN